jgi:hypothetical protein
MIHPSVAALIILALAVLISYSMYSKEGFQVVAQVPAVIPVKSCPSLLQMKIQKTGDMDCVDTTGAVMCTLSPSHDSIPTCTDYIHTSFTKKALSNCPKKLPYYFEKEGVRGCTEGAAATGGPLCTIYPTEGENYVKDDSCFLYQKMEQFVCPFPNGETFLMSGVIMCRSLTAKGLVQCGKDDLLLKYLHKTFSGWQNTFDPSQKGIFCSIAADSIKTGKSVESYPWPV